MKKILDKIKAFLAIGARKTGSSVVKGATSRQARYGSNSLIALIAVVGILVLGNLLVKNQGWRWDSTKNKVNSLSPETLKVIKKINKPVKFIVFSRPEFQQDTQKLLKEYTSRNNKISSEFINPFEKPALAQQYGITRADTTLVIPDNNQANKQELHSNTENDFTTALIKITNPSKVKVVFWSGSGEKDINDETEPGLSEFKSALSNLNYTVEKQDAVLNPQVATGTGVLVIAGPQKSYTDKQKNALKDYLNAGGRALVMLDPIVGDTQRSGLEDILSQYGVDVPNGLVLDTLQFVNNDIRIPAVADYEKHQITDSLQVTLYPGARAVNPTSKLPDHIFVDPLIKSTAQSWLETTLTQGSKIEKNPSDPAGPVTMGVAVRYAGDKNDPKNKMRLVVFGDSDMGTNLLTKPEQGKQIYAPGNIDLVVNSVNWLAAQENLINITPKDRSNPPLTLTDIETKQVFYLVIVVLPAIALIIGFIVWRMRRRARKK